MWGFGLLLCVSLSVASPRESLLRSAFADPQRLFSLSGGENFCVSDGVAVLESYREENDWAVVEGNCRVTLAASKFRALLGSEEIVQLPFAWRVRWVDDRIVQVVLIQNHTLFFLFNYSLRLFALPFPTRPNACWTLKCCLTRRRCCSKRTTISGRCCRTDSIQFVPPPCCVRGRH